MNFEEFIRRFHYDREKDHLGGGGFGNVYKVNDTYHDRTLALKVAEVRKGLEDYSLQNEVALSVNIEDHPNIARYEKCYRFHRPTGTYDFAILQYYPEGNLTQLIRNRNLSYTQKEEIAKGIIAGIDHIHRQNIIHRDMKSSNILMVKRSNGKYVPKIADFGISKQFSGANNARFENSFVGGSILYAAPEQLSNAKVIRMNVDLWSMGVVLYELFTTQLPFEPKNKNASESGRVEIIEKINKGRIPDAIRTIPEPWRKLIHACLQPDPEKRIKSTTEAYELLGISINELRPNSLEKYENTWVDEDAKLKKENSSGKGSRFPKYLLYILGGILLAGVGYIVWPKEKEGYPILYHSSGVYGFENSEGEIIISAKYEEAFPFMGGKAKVEVSDSVYFINTAGDIVELVSITENKVNEKNESTEIDKTIPEEEEEGTPIHPVNSLNELFNLVFEPGLSKIERLNRLSTQRSYVSNLTNDRTIIIVENVLAEEGLYGVLNTAASSDQYALQIEEGPHMENGKIRSLTLTKANQ